MSNELSRREFVSALCMGTATLAIDPLGARATTGTSAIKPIRGTWFEFQHHATVEGVDWNPALARFSAEQWGAKVNEIAEVGIEYLVLMATAVYYRSFYKTQIYPKWELGCPDPLEAVLVAADRYKLKVFIGAGFYGNWEDRNVIVDLVARRKRLQSLGEIVKLYGHHPSFHGWYWPDEAELNPHYTPQFLDYVNTLSHEARQLKRDTPIMIAPYGTRKARADDDYVRQLDSMDIDIVAYQDEVGVRKSEAAETGALYEGLRKAHDRAQKAKIWADVEIFKFEDRVYGSALLPAAFERVLHQLEAVSPFVDTVLVYQYLGMMNKPNSVALAGAPQSANLYSDYIAWLRGRI